jgi:lipoprotein NlpI
MFRYSLGVLAVLFAVGSAYAAAYDDFADGVAAYERGDATRAITSLTAALNAPDLSPNLKVTAYLDRGRAYLRNGQCAPALSDIQAAKALNANEIEVTVSLATAQDCAGDFKSAEASYTAAIAIEPNWQFFFARGRTRWAQDKFADAADDFAAVIRANPKYQYPVLWLAITQSRITKPDTDAFARAASSLDLDNWPGPLVKFYIGQARQLDVDAGVHSDTQNVAARQCEADFYVGEWQLAHLNAAAARPLLQSAFEKCPANFVERGAAKIEIARLK